MRFVGQESTLEVDLPADPGRGFLARSFRERYLDLFGYDPGDRPIELESVEVLVAAETAERSGRWQAEAAAAGAPARGQRFRVASGWREAPTVERAGLGPETELAGPALVLEAHSVTVVEPGWSASADPAGAIVLRRRSDAI